MNNSLSRGLGYEELLEMNGAEPYDNTVYCCTTLVN